MITIGRSKKQPKGRARGENQEQARQSRGSRKAQETETQGPTQVQRSIQGRAKGKLKEKA